MKCYLLNSKKHTHHHSSNQSYSHFISNFFICFYHICTPCLSLQFLNRYIDTRIEIRFYSFSLVGKYLQNFNSIIRLDFFSGFLTLLLALTDTKNLIKKIRLKTNPQFCFFFSLSSFYYKIYLYFHSLSLI